MNKALMSIFTSLWLFSGGASAQVRLVYFTSELQGGDIYYVRREAGKAEFTSPLRINSEPGSALAVGTIRAAHLAVGKNRRVHVAWNGRHDPGGHDAPMLYARRNCKKA